MALSGVSNRSPQQIWEWVLSILQTDMSRAAYETWVKPAEVVSFDAGIFTIGCYNDYACQWLESRLKQTVEHMLSGFAGQAVRVKFDLLSNTISDAENIENDDVKLGEKDCEDAKASRLQTVHASLPDALIEPDRNGDPGPGEEDYEGAKASRLQPVHASLRDALIEPDRVVKMPTYFLRWLPFVGART